MSDDWLLSTEPRATRNAVEILARNGLHPSMIATLTDCDPIHVDLYLQDLGLFFRPAERAERLRITRAIRHGETVAIVD